MLTSQYSLCRRYWLAFKDVVRPKQAPKCFLPQDSLFIKLDNEDLINDFLSLLYEPCYPKFSWPCTYCPYHCCYQTIAETLLYLFAFFFWCSALAVICEKHYGFSTFLVIWVCRLAFLLNKVLKKVQRIYPRASNFIWS